MRFTSPKGSGRPTSSQDELQHAAQSSNTWGVNFVRCFWHVPRLSAVWQKRSLWSRLKIFGHVLCPARTRKHTHLQGVWSSLQARRKFPRPLRTTNMESYVPETSNIMGTIFMTLVCEKRCIVRYKMKSLRPGMDRHALHQMVRIFPYQLHQARASEVEAKGEGFPGHG